MQGAAGVYLPFFIGTRQAVFSALFDDAAFYRRDVAAGKAGVFHFLDEVEDVVAQDVVAAKAAAFAAKGDGRDAAAGAGGEDEGAGEG